MGCCKCEEYSWDNPQEVVYTAPEDGKKYCLFHAPPEHKGMSVKKFNAKVLERIQAITDLEDEKATCDFSGVIFPGDFGSDLQSRLPRILFIDAQFQGDTDFRGKTFGENTSFRSAIFQQDTVFSEVVFKGNVSFAFALFRNDVDFDNSIFRGEANFNTTTFEGGAYFSDATFEGITIFHQTTFGAGADFVKAYFRMNTYFSMATFLENGDFSGVTFDKFTNFDAATFKGYGSFGRATFKNSVWFSNATFGEACFSEAAFEGEVNFTKAIFDGQTVFIQTAFVNHAGYYAAQCNGHLLFDSVEIKKDTSLSFAKCTISQEGITFNNCAPYCIDLIGQYDLSNIRFIDSPWDRNGRIKSCNEDELLQQTRDFYQRMKAKYKAENNEYEASKWHIAEKEAQLKLLAQKKGEGFNWFMLWLYKLVSGFGENPGRAFGVLVCLLVVPLLFCSVDIEANFFGLTFHSHQVADPIAQWLKYIPLTRAMAGEPSSGWRALMFFWQLLITLQAALFAFALRNNFRR